MFLRKIILSMFTLFIQLTLAHCLDRKACTIKPYTIVIITAEL
jgi:hypothetical protein